MTVFRKIPHGLVLRERKSRNNREDKQTLSSSTYTKTFRYFNDIAGYEGIFIAGIDIETLLVYKNKNDNTKYIILKFTVLSAFS